MRHRFMTVSVLLFILVIASTALCSCSASFVTLPNGKSSPSASETNLTVKGTRDNSPIVMTGNADGITVSGNDSVTIDTSHTQDGYCMVEYTGNSQIVKLQITGPDTIRYTYDLHGDYEVFPLTAGDGDYQLAIFENIEGSSYSTLFTQHISVTLANEFSPYLYANQYVDFRPDSAVITEAKRLAAPADSDIEVVENIYNYIISNYTYDYAKAETVVSGYLPDIDAILHTQTGICFDYAAVMAAMLRTQNIPTRLEIGYRGDVYHAWISTYIKGAGWINGIIKFDGTNWELMDPTFASTSPSPSSFTADDELYLTKYMY